MIFCDIRVLFIGINPGAEYGPAKRWPIDRFTDVAARIEPQVHPAWLIFGAAVDFPSATQFENGLRKQHNSAAILNLAGEPACANFASASRSAKSC